MNSGNGRPSKILYSIYENEPIHSQLIEGFIQKIPGRVDEIRASIEDIDKSGADQEEFSSLCHQLKGTLLVYGFMEFADQIAEIEAFSREGDLGRATVKVEQISCELKTFFETDRV